MKKRLLSLLLCVAMCMGCLTVTSNAASGMWYSTRSSTVGSYLYDNGSGITCVKWVGGTRVVVEDYDYSFNYISSRSLTGELTLWGGFYAGDKYNFLIYGTDNTQESDTAEVIRVVKYDKNWNRLGMCSISDIYTARPFVSASLRCAEYGDYLYIHTGREMYRSSDGLRHQSNMTLAVRQSDMSFVNFREDVANNFGYVSHSFNQFIMVDSSNKLVTLDHGDAYPRAVVLQRYLVDLDTWEYEDYVWGETYELQTFAGEIGDNDTGASVGGLAETRDAYVIAYNYDPNGPDYGSHTGRFPVFHCLNKNTGSSERLILSRENCATPVLASTGLDGGYMLWQNVDEDGKGALCYVAYGANGQPGPVQEAEADFPDCQPIPYKDGVLWYNEVGDTITFYTLDANGVKSHSVKKVDQNPSNSGHFSDVPIGHWAYRNVLYAVQKGLFAGVSATEFAPDAGITQAQMAMVLARCAGQEVDDASPWYQKGMDWAKNAGIVTTENANHALTREEFSIMLYRYAKYMGKQVEASSSVLEGFGDAASLSGDGTAAMRWAVHEGLMNGTSENTLSPNAPVTRAQAATMLARYDMYVKVPQPDRSGPLTIGCTAAETSDAIWDRTMKLWQSTDKIIASCDENDFDTNTYTWSISDPSVLKLSTYEGKLPGTLSAIGPGTATITVTDNHGHSASFVIVVTEH